MGTFRQEYSAAVCPNMQRVEKKINKVATRFFIAESI
jgi:hypothetical protein